MKVVYFMSASESQSWNNGLFILVNEDRTSYDLCKLGKDGEPQKFNDGKLMITKVGIGNKMINTKLTYNE